MLNKRLSILFFSCLVFLFCFADRSIADVTYDPKPTSFYYQKIDKMNRQYGSHLTIDACIDEAKIYTWNLDRPMKGLDLLMKAYNMDPTNINTMYELGCFYAFKVNDAEKADELFRKVLKVSPFHEHAYINLGFNMYWNMDDHKKGIKILRDMISIAPYNADAHHVLADCLYDQKDYNGAIKEYKTALGLEPTNTNYVIALAKVYAYGLKDPGRAIEMLDKYPLKPEFVLVFKELGNIYK